MATASRKAAGFVVMRRACALVGLFALFLQGSSGGHMLLVEHTRCAEHGELVHGHAAHPHAGASHDRAAGPALSRAPGQSGDEAHGHCALRADRRDALADVGAAPLLVWRDHPHELLLVEGPGAGPQPSRFRIAPKNSPPA